MILSTLCYIEKDGKYLMLHRTKKKNDINKDKWLGIGGKFEEIHIQLCIFFIFGHIIYKTIFLMQKYCIKNKNVVYFK